MNVTDFTRLSKAGIMYRLVDANKPGYMTSPSVVIEADQNVVRSLFGDRDVEGFEIYSKNVLTLYIK